MLPSQANPPKPSDAAVYIENRPALDVYVKAFGGWAVGDKYLRVRSVHHGWLKPLCMPAHFSPHEYQSVGVHTFFTIVPG